MTSDEVRERLATYLDEQVMYGVCEECDQPCGCKHFGDACEIATDVIAALAGAGLVIGVEFWELEELRKGMSPEIAAEICNVLDGQGLALVRVITP